MTVLIDVEAMLETERESLSETFTSLLLSDENSFRSELNDATLLV
jgi:hypothetical protein